MIPGPSNNTYNSYQAFSQVGGWMNAEDLNLTNPY